MCAAAWRSCRALALTLRTWLCSLLPVSRSSRAAHAQGSVQSALGHAHGPSACSPLARSNRLRSWQRAERIGTCAWPIKQPGARHKRTACAQQSRLASISVLTAGVLLGYLEKIQLFGLVGPASILVMARAVSTPAASRRLWPSLGWSRDQLDRITGFFLDIPTTPTVNYNVTCIPCMRRTCCAVRGRNHTYMYRLEGAVRGAAWYHSYQYRG